MNQRLIGTPLVWVLFLMGALGSAGCNSALVWGNLAVLALSVGIFVSTLALGRTRKR